MFTIQTKRKQERVCWQQDENNEKEDKGNDNVLRPSYRAEAGRSKTEVRYWRDKKKQQQQTNKKTTETLFGEATVNSWPTWPLV